MESSVQQQRVLFIHGAASDAEALAALRAVLLPKMWRLGLQGRSPTGERRPGLSSGLRP
jgi:hypothetical protein